MEVYTRYATTQRSAIVQIRLWTDHCLNLANTRDKNIREADVVEPLAAIGIGAAVPTTGHVMVKGWNSMSRGWDEKAETHVLNQQEERKQCSDDIAQELDYSSKCDQRLIALPNHHQLPYNRQHVLDDGRTVIRERNNGVKAWGMSKVADMVY